jgi:hypothetical protein
LACCSGMDLGCTGRVMGGDFLEKRCVVAQSLTPVDAFVTLAIAAVQRVLKQDHSVPKWRNWQTRMVQVHVPARVWGFESLLRHQSFLEKQFSLRSFGSRCSLRISPAGSDARD